MNFDNLTMCAEKNQPRHQQIKRETRLQSAKTWIAKYPGKNLIKGYRKHFGVDWRCAIQELQMLGVRRNTDFYGGGKPIGEKETNDYLKFTEDAIRKIEKAIR